MTEIKNSNFKDLPEIAECHRSAFPDSLSSKMGNRYLSKMIEWYLSGEKKFLFHAVEDGKIVGYCGGMINDGTQATGSASGMIQYSFNYAVISIALRPWLLFHKEFQSKLTLISKNIRRKLGLKKKKKSNSAAKSSVSSDVRNISKSAEPVAGLVVIGVSKEYMGKGYGSILLQEFEKKSKEMNIKQMALSVKSENKKAIKSYERNGWVITKETGDYYEMEKTI
ncbi:MAG TPA: GNAT family N-acetyltransferase [Ignavibacteria bacterium]|nr:GNAT family N-acetyltransferase [Ignavibacteria bacterium]